MPLFNIPMIYYALIGFALGVWWLQCFGALFSVWSMPAVIIMVIFLIAAIFFFLNFLEVHSNFRIFSKFIKVVLLIFLTISLGATWANWRANIRLNDKLLAILEEEKSHQLIGTIVDLPVLLPKSFVDRKGWRFLFKPQNSNLQDASAASVKYNNYPQYILLTWYVKPIFSKSLSSQDFPKLNVLAPEPGQRWQFTVKLKRPHGLFNPGGHDFESWMLQRNIGATGVVRSGNYLGDESSFFAWLGRKRATISTHINKALAVNTISANLNTIFNKEIGKYNSDKVFSAGIIQALAIGEQRAISEEDWSRFRATGTNHLIAISGLHITMIAGLVMTIFSWCWKSNSRLMLWIPAKIAGMFIGLFAALYYGFISGLHIPAQRALIMLIVVVFSYIGGRIIPKALVLFWALFFVLLFDPWAVLAPSFYLSFIAVAIILLAMNKINFSDQKSTLVQQKLCQNLGRNLQANALVQLSISLALIPLSALFFGEVTLLSFFANILMIPLFSIVIVPLVLLGVITPVWLAKYLFTAVQIALHYSGYFLDILRFIPYGVWKVATPSTIVLILAFLGVAWIIFAGPYRYCYRIFGLFLIWPIFWRQPSSKVQTGEFYATVLDVGQGGAVFIQTANHNLLFDSGPAYSSNNDAATRVILPYLNFRMVKHLDVLVISHQDRDHSGGMRTLLQNFSVKNLLSSIPSEHVLLQNLSKINIAPCHNKQSWQWDGVWFRMLHPEKSSLNSIKKSNSQSCTLHVSTAHHSLLLPGDIGIAEEVEILSRLHAENQKIHLQASVLLMPHHGSKTSSSSHFLAEVNPSLAIAQVGYCNNFKHPRPEILERYKKQGAQILRSDYHGAIEINTDGEKLYWSSWRELKKRYWHINLT